MPRLQEHATYSGACDVFRRMQHIQEAAMAPTGCLPPTCATAPASREKGTTAKNLLPLPPSQPCLVLHGPSPGPGSVHSPCQHGKPLLRLRHAVQHALGRGAVRKQRPALAAAGGTVLFILPCSSAGFSTGIVLHWGTNSKESEAGERVCLPQQRTPGRCWGRGPCRARHRGKPLPHAPVLRPLRYCSSSSGTGSSSDPEASMASSSESSSPRMGTYSSESSSMASLQRGAARLAHKQDIMSP